MTFRFLLDFRQQALERNVGVQQLIARDTLRPFRRGRVPT